MASQSLSTVRQLKDIPALRQFAVLAGIAIAVAIGLWAWSWSQRPAYVPVYANLSDRDAAELSEALRTSMIPFELDRVSGSVLVPTDQVHEARLKLAGQGLPRGSGQGFEAMGQEQGFGTSQFIETARYQHALETELARTIGNLQPVRAARVHLAIPKPSAFTRNREAPSASVFVQLQSGRELEQSQVASIIHMVAASVPGLSAQDVAVVDQSGRLMSNQGDSALAQSSEQLSYQRRVEGDYARRIEQLLTPLVGAGRISAQVAADIDFSVTEEARESYTPDATKVRSEQTSEDVTRAGASMAAVGIPGATSNQPPPDKANPPLNSVNAAGNPQSDIQTQSKQATRSYELDRTLSHTRQSAGKLQRLSVAVLVDHVPRPKSGGKPNEVELMPLSTAELTQVQALVKEAVGFNATRGDSVEIQNAAFLQNEITAVEALPIWREPQVQGYARLGAGLLLLLILIFVVVRPALRSLLNAPVRAAIRQALPDLAVNDDQGGLRSHAQVVSAQPHQLAYEQKLQAARQAVAQDPKRVAQVVKNWVGQEA
ncbi:MAG: flagellar M-ring protein FliF [Pseudomonadota bacterium]|nr:flagellar M-ring protein FliF [Pseudomonadota bacterium]